MSVIGARLASMASCASAFASCSTQCAALSSVPPACTGAVNAFFACAGDSPVSCSGTTANFTACTSQQNAVLSCLGVGPVDVGLVNNVIGFVARFAPQFSKVLKLEEAVVGASGNLVVARDHANSLLRMVRCCESQ